MEKDCLTKVLAHRLSNMLYASFCSEAIEEAIACYGAPEVFNTDQEAQFTSKAFNGALQVHGVHISMERQGSLDRQRVRGAPLAQSQAGGNLPACVRDRRGQERNRRDYLRYLQEERPY